MNHSMVTDHPTGRQDRILQQLSDLRRVCCVPHGLVDYRVVTSRLVSTFKNKSRYCEIGRSQNTTYLIGALTLYLY